MTHSIIVAAPSLQLPEPGPAPAAETTVLLRQLLELQKEQLAAIRALHTAPLERLRWRGLVSRHEPAFSPLPADAKRVLPSVEKCYLGLLAEVVEKLADPELLDDEYATADLLDRYGQRLSQLGNLLGQLGQLSSIAD